MIIPVSSLNALSPTKRHLQPLLKSHNVWNDSAQAMTRAMVLGKWSRDWQTAARSEFQQILAASSRMCQANFVKESKADVHLE